MNAKKRPEGPKGILLIGYGNPGRLDDGLGPALAAELEKKNINGLEVDSDYQLTVEHASDVAGHEVVIFADADVSGEEPFHFTELSPASDRPGFSSHSVEPGEVLALAARLFGASPKGFVLGIRGYEFDGFGERLSDKARTNLAAAVTYVEKKIRNGLL